MLSGFLIATALIGAQPVAPQLGRPIPPPPATEKDKAPPPAPTPWFNKDEDTFDLPTDPARRAELEADVKQGKKYAAEVLKETKASKNMSYQERVERIGQKIAHIANHMHAIALWGDKRFSPYHYHYTVLCGDELNA